MAPIDPRDFGRIEAEVQAMQRQIEDMASDLKAVRTMMDSAPGRNILTRISRAPAGSDMETRLVNQFNASFRDQAAAMSREVSQ